MIIAITNVTQTVKGVSTVKATTPANQAGYYALRYQTVIRPGGTVNILKSVITLKGESIETDNLFCATTYAEIQGEATNLGIANLPTEAAVIAAATPKPTPAK